MSNNQLLAARVGDDACPSNDLEIGEPSGQCWGDGHYACKSCRHYRADFKRNGQDYIDFVHSYQMIPHLIAL